MLADGIIKNFRDIEFREDNMKNKLSKAIERQEKADDYCITPGEMNCARPKGEPAN